MQFSTLVSGLVLASVAVAVPAPVAGANKYHHPKPTHTTSPSPPWASQCPDIGISAAYKKQVVNQFATDQIVPDLIERINPTVVVNVTYDTTDEGEKAVQLGTYFTTEETINAPTLSFSAEKDYDPFTTYYTYFLIDPDVPEDGSPVQVNFEHWCVGNAQPSCVTDQSPETIVIYEPLTPLSTTQHRYTFLVYRQPPNYNPEAEELQLQLRTPFDLNDFTEKYNLTLVGGNFLKESIVNGLQDGTGSGVTSAVASAPSGTV
jgi:phosphatidylethanolamine-binding protein